MDGTVIGLLLIMVFLYYYSSNNQFDQAARVNFLGEASVRKSTMSSDPPFCFDLDFGPIKRKFCAQDDGTFGTLD